MALTKIPSELSSTTGIVDNSNATAITIDSNENVGIGTASPSGLLTSYKSLNGDPKLGHFYNDNTGTAAEAAVYITNSSSVSDGLFLQAYGQNGTTAGGFVQDAAIIGSGTGTSGGLSIMTRANADMRFYTNGHTNERMRVDTSGNLLVGKTSNTFSASGFVANANGMSATRSGGACVQINRTSSDGSIQEFYKDGSTVGSISVTSSSTSYNTSSDYRLKENVVELTGATERLKQLNPSRFNFIADADTTVDGFLAHEVADVVPEAISGTKDAMKDEEYEVTPAVLDEEGNVVTEAVIGTRSVPEYQGIDQSKLVPLLVATIQELEARITELENN